MHNVVYYLEGIYGVFGGPTNALQDLGFMLIPEINTSSLPFLPTNGILFGLFAIGFVALSFPFFFPLKFSFSPVQALWRGSFVASICVFLRTISFIFTLLPAPNIHCQRYLTGANLNGESFYPPQSLAEIFSAFGTDSGCGDLIFSSHVMYALVVVCTMFHYYPTNLIRYILAILVITLALLCIAQRSHYTVDVIVACYTVPLVWLSLCHLIPRDIQSFRFWLDQPQ